jgi:hypothetical protein
MRKKGDLKSAQGKTASFSEAVFLRKKTTAFLPKRGSRRSVFLRDFEGKFG